MNEAFVNWLATFWTQNQTLIRIVLVLVFALILRAVLLASVRRIVSGVVTGVRGKGAAKVVSESPVEKARIVQRTKTMGSVLSNFITWTITIIAVIQVLGELGVAVGGLIAGAGIIGAAIGFGAQSLVRDLITGLFIVFEDQYGVGDIVDLGEVKGSVEAVGLRVTQVKDFEGTLWYVRNGEISRVGNKSQGWSRVVLDLAIDVNTDRAKATATLLAAAAEVQASPVYSASIVSDAEVWGVHTFNGDEVVLRLVMQVDHKVQDDIARALREATLTQLKKSKISLSSGKNAIFVNLQNSK
ncbi:MAG: mechanosensitive ion channel family protein [Microbacteriaceae bacterium]|nr:mechanosensitive ion channel family protein [Microbacteriaceae bacterium]